MAREWCFKGFSQGEPSSGVQPVTIAVLCCFQAVHVDNTMLKGRCVRREAVVPFDHGDQTGGICKSCTGR